MLLAILPHEVLKLGQSATDMCAKKWASCRGVASKDAIMKIMMASELNPSTRRHSLQPTARGKYVLPALARLLAEVSRVRHSVAGNWYVAPSAAVQSSSKQLSGSNRWRAARSQRRYY